MNRQGLSFWWKWVGISVVALGTGSLALLTLGSWVLQGVLTGSIMAVGQWLVLRDKLKGPPLWIPATAIAWFVGFIITWLLQLPETQPALAPLTSALAGVGPPSQVEIIVGLLIMGLIVGTTQAIVYRSRFPRPAWWVIASGVSLVAGWFVSHGVDQIGVGLYYGLITGLTLNFYPLIDLNKNRELAAGTMAKPAVRSGQGGSKSKKRIERERRSGDRRR